MYYFAYGSNLSTRYLHTHCPEATFLRCALLPNYRVEFRRYSSAMQGGISSIIEAPGELVHGVIYQVNAADIDLLDILEAVPQGIYRRDSFLVLGEGGKWHHAELYRVSEPAGPYAPAEQYLDLMIEGAIEHNLASIYIASLIDLRKSLY